jgi:hypothetical protein
MSKLKSICAEVIAAGEKATERPWLFELQENATEPNRRYLALSANHADKLARVAVVMEEALQSIAADIHEDSGDEGEYCECPAHQALAQVEEALAHVEELLK